ncbi:hypothetical protein [Prauserella cavernicola]|uniref:Uncharacterized protein n=1 Tax=Prauserella cavernicola TaxID=2800127 RepID=A0A934V8Z2_9PSEU|nr:hypothetical protein [Prauserella cavernicola]MBK1788293.1 hypothetical protein [Prauserella cavernicola]
MASLDPVPSGPAGPDPSGERTPFTGPRLFGIIAAVLLVLAAALTVVGTFQPLFSGRVTALGQPGFELKLTGWGVDTDAPQQNGGVPLNGLPLVFAAALLLGAAGLCLLPALRRAAGLLTAVATAFLAGAGWVVAMQVLSWIDTFRSTEASAEAALQVDTTTSVGLGTWLFAGALVLAIAATVFALRAPSAGTVSVAEQATPRFGLPAPGVTTAPYPPNQAGAPAPQPRSEVPGEPDPAKPLE